MDKNLFLNQGTTLLSGGARSPLRALVLITLATWASVAANAQVIFGSMVGNVTDPTGAAVPAATVKLTNVATNDVLSLTTNDAGVYTIADLNAGTYRVEVSKEG